MDEYLESLPDDHTESTIFDGEDKVPTIEIKRRYRNLLHRLYSSLSREDLIKIRVASGKYNSLYNPSDLIDEYCKVRSMDLTACDLAVKKIPISHIIWDLHKEEIIRKYEHITTEKLINIVVEKYFFPLNPYELRDHYAMVYNDVRMHELQLKAYEKNDANLISVYREMYNENHLIIYDKKKKFISSDGTYIFKYSTTPPDERNEILHELFIGLMVTNNFPGFSKIYSGQIDVDCPTKLENMWKCSYLVGQNIEGVDFYSWLNSNRKKFRRDEKFSKDIFKLFKTVINNLWVAYEATYFTHYDLHLGNVIITEDQDPVIIDFGLSFAKLDGVNIGTMLTDGEVYNRPMWQHDVFKLLFCIYGQIEYTWEDWGLIHKFSTFYKSVIPCGRSTNYKNRLTLIFENIKPFYPELELKLDFTGDTDYVVDEFKKHYHEVLELVHNRRVTMIFNKLLFEFTKVMGCKFYDGTQDDEYTTIENTNHYREEYNEYGAPAREMMETPFTCTEFKDLVNSINY